MKDIFYTLPATDIEAGMSTEDGQDVVDVDVDDGWVLYHTVTPGHQDETDARMSPVGRRVHLAVFKDTEVDGSHYPAALIVEVDHA